MPLAKTSSNFSVNFSTSNRSTENERAVNIHLVKVEERLCVIQGLFSAFSIAAFRHRMRT